MKHLKSLKSAPPAYIVVKLTGGTSEAHNFVSGGRGGTGFCTVSKIFCTVSKIKIIR